MKPYLPKTRKCFHDKLFTVALTTLLKVIKLNKKILLTMPLFLIALASMVFALGPTITISNPANNTILNSSATSVSIIIYTNESATCRYDNISENFIYESSTNQITPLGPGTTHAIFGWSVSSGNTYNIYYKCNSTDWWGSGMNDIAAYHTFSVNSTANATDTTPPVISNVINATSATNNVTIAWDTDENANSTVEYGFDTGYGSAQNDAAFNTAHSVLLTGLATGGITYHYRVASCDAAGNCATSSDYSFTTISTAAASTNCTDTDGKDYYTKGIAGLLQEHEDYCKGTTSVVEYSCGENTIKDEDYFIVMANGSDVILQYKNYDSLNQEVTIKNVDSGDVTIHTVGSSSDWIFDLYLPGKKFSFQVLDPSADRSDIQLIGEPMILGEKVDCPYGCEDGACKTCSWPSVGDWTIGQDENVVCNNEDITLNSIDYEVTVSSLTDTDAVFIVNGETTSALSEWEGYTLADGSYINVNDIFSEDGKTSVVYCINLPNSPTGGCDASAEGETSIKSIGGYLSVGNNANFTLNNSILNVAGADFLDNARSNLENSVTYGRFDFSGNTVNRMHNVEFNENVWFGGDSTNVIENSLFNNSEASIQYWWNSANTIRNSTFYGYSTFNDNSFSNIENSRFYAWIEMAGSTVNVMDSSLFCRGIDFRINSTNNISNSKFGVGCPKESFTYTDKETGEELTKEEDIWASLEFLENSINNIKNSIFNNTNLEFMDSSKTDIIDSIIYSELSLSTYEFDDLTIENIKPGIVNAVISPTAGQFELKLANTQLEHINFYGRPNSTTSIINSILDYAGFAEGSTNLVKDSTINNTYFNANTHNTIENSRFDELAVYENSVTSISDSTTGFISVMSAINDLTITGLKPGTINTNIGSIAITNTNISDFFILLAGDTVNSVLDSDILGLVTGNGYFTDFGESSLITTTTIENSDIGFFLTGGNAINKIHNSTFNSTRYSNLIKEETGKEENVFNAFSDSNNTIENSNFYGRIALTGNASMNFEDSMLDGIYLIGSPKNLFVTVVKEEANISWLDRVEGTPISCEDIGDCPEGVCGADIETANNIEAGGDGWVCLSDEEESTNNCETNDDCDTGEICWYYSETCKSVLTAEEIDVFKEYPIIKGTLNITNKTVDMFFNNTFLTRHYPIYIDAIGPAGNKLVSIKDNGNLIWSGTTDSNGYAEAVLVFDNSTYNNVYDVVIDKVIVDSISLTKDTPIRYTLPVIYNLVNSSITDTSATISWDTNKNIGAKIYYGLTKAYENLITDETLSTTHSFDITSLLPNMLYQYKAESCDEVNYCAVSYGTLVTSEPADNTAPVISNIAVSSITTSSAAIGWDTDEAATSKIEYGITSGYGINTTLDARLLTSHAIALTGLTPATEYHYRAWSCDSADNCEKSGDNTFTTTEPGCSYVSDAVCPTTCSAGSDIDCCTDAGKYWIPTRGCYDTNSYGAGNCSVDSVCNMTSSDGCAPTWCAAGSDADNCLFKGNCWVDQSWGKGCFSPGYTNPENYLEYCATSTSQTSWTSKAPQFDSVTAWLGDYAGTQQIFYVIADMSEAVSLAGKAMPIPGDTRTLTFTLINLTNHAYSTNTVVGANRDVEYVIYATNSNGVTNEFSGIVKAERPNIIVSQSDNRRGDNSKFKNQTVYIPDNKTVELPLDGTHNSRLLLKTDSEVLKKAEVIDVFPINNPSTYASLPATNALESFEINMTFDNSTTNLSYCMSYAGFSSIDENSIKAYKLVGSSWNETDSTKDATTKEICAIIRSAQTPYLFGGETKSDGSSSGGGGGGGGGSQVTTPIPAPKPTPTPLVKEILKEEKTKEETISLFGEGKRPSLKERISKITGAVTGFDGPVSSIGYIVMLSVIIIGLGTYTISERRKYL